MNTRMDKLVLQDVTKCFDGTPACSGIQLAIRKGEFFTFLGPSGCGKTTLLRLIAGFIRPDRGAIFLDGREITHLAPEKRHVGMVFQNYALFPYLNVQQNIAYGLTLRKLPARQIRDTVARYLQMVGLKGFERRRIESLSGGEQQRVALARSLVVEPDVLLLDEPLSNLDARLRESMRQEIKALQKKLGLTTIFVTHDQTEALTLSDRIAIFNQGRIIQVGEPEYIHANPNSAFAAGFLGHANLFPATIKENRAVIAGTLVIRLARSHANGAFIAIRPQEIHLSAIPPEGANTFKGRLLERQVHGVWIEFKIDVQGVVLHAAALNTIHQPLDFRAGATVYLSIAEMAVRVLNE